MKKLSKYIFTLLLLFIAFFAFNNSVRAERGGKACSEIGEDACNNRNNCDWDSGIQKCVDLPTGSPETRCQKIKSEKKCLADNDCDYYDGECNDLTTIAIIKKIKNQNEEFDIKNVEFKCSDVKYLTEIWLVIRIAAPFLIILFGSLDFLRSIMAGDEKKMKESRSKFIKRLIAFILLIVLPFTIQFLFNTMGTGGSENMCLVKCIATNNTSSEGCD